MSIEELREEIDIETELIEAVLTELKELRQDVAGRTPTIRETTAAAAFLAQFYGGVENILKRVSLSHSLPLPAGENWHSELFQRFCEPTIQPLPALFDHSLGKAMAPYRKFRHLAFHTYGIQMDWNRMEEGIAGVEDVFARFRKNLQTFLSTAAKSAKN
jgi:hypothetical protein